MIHHSLRGNWRNSHLVERAVAAVAFGLLIAALPGCGGSNSMPDRYPVSGTVTYNGEPLSRGLVSFHPQNKTGRPAFAEINRDGSFELSTFENNDGAVPGKYKVTVQIHEAPGPLIPGPEPTETAAETAPSDAATAETSETAPPDDDVAPTEAASPVPVKYTDRDTTPIEFEVTAGPNKPVLTLSDE